MDSVQMTKKGSHYKSGLYLDQKMYFFCLKFPGYINEMQIANKRGAKIGTKAVKYKEDRFIFSVFSPAWKIFISRAMSERYGWRLMSGYFIYWENNDSEQ